MDALFKGLRFFTAFCAIALLGACSQEGPTQPQLTGDISAADLNERILNSNAPLILDVRSDSEFASGHLPGAINISHNQFVDDPSVAVELLSAGKDTEIVVHCASGRRAAIAEQVMIDSGYTNVRHLAGDYQGWQASDYPLVHEN